MAKTVFVGLSGGVDSSVAALRLQQAGYTVVGVFIKVWHPTFMPCEWEAERRDAMRIAAFLGIPFLTCDAETAYFENVAQYFISAYEAGETPNPDVMCNQYVKFGAFYDFARAQGADYIATGHYARVVSNADGSARLYRGIDENKDQSYFLWTLPTDHLEHVLFPLGDSQKSTVRDEAAQYGLPTATKAESQGICFLGHVDVYDFLSHYLTLTEGPVLDRQGVVIGTHRGAAVYTPGQRHGFTVSAPAYAGQPCYVQHTNVADNEVVVDTQPPQLRAADEIHLHQTVLRTKLLPEQSVQYQTRYRQTPQTATVREVDDNLVTLGVVERGESIASGQSCVLYDGAHCLGGGIIQA